MLQSIPVSEYTLAPMSYQLPRAMAHMKAGQVVVLTNDQNVYPYNHPDTKDKVVMLLGILLSETFPYGVALIASQMDGDQATEVWIEDGQPRNPDNIYHRPQPYERNFIDDAIDDAIGKNPPPNS